MLSRAKTTMIYRTAAQQWTEGDRQSAKQKISYTLYTVTH